MKIVRFDAKAQGLAQETGLDKLGQAKLARLDKNGDGTITLTDVRRVVKDAGLEKDGSLSRADRQRIDAALGGGAKTSSTATTGPSSVVSAMTGGKKTLADTYMSTKVVPSAKGVSISIDGGLWNAGGGHTGDKSRAAVIPGFEPAAVTVLFYGTEGQTGLPNSSGGPEKGFVGTAFGGGMAVAVADKTRGLVLIDVAARDFLDGKQPPHKRLASLPEIAKSPAVRAFAKKHGLDPKSLEVKLTDVKLSAAFVDSSVNTLVFDAKLTDAKGKSKSGTFSTYLEGSFAKSVDKMKLDALEAGVEYSWGRMMPPSAKPKKETGKAKDVEGGASTGGGEGATTTHDNGTAHVGGGEGVHVHTGGGE